MELKQIIKNTEERFISYKKMLESTFKEKSVAFPDWYKDFLREQKNIEEVWLKKLIAEATNEKIGFNPPCCYTHIEK